MYIPPPNIIWERFHCQLQDIRAQQRFRSGEEYPRAGGEVRKKPTGFEFIFFETVES